MRAQGPLSPHRDDRWLLRRKLDQPKLGNTQDSKPVLYIVRDSPIQDRHDEGTEAPGLSSKLDSNAVIISKRHSKTFVFAPDLSIKLQGLYKRMLCDLWVIGKIIPN